MKIFFFALKAVIEGKSNKTKRTAKLNEELNSDSKKKNEQSMVNSNIESKEVIKSADKTNDDKKLASVFKMESDIWCNNIANFSNPSTKIATFGTRNKANFKVMEYNKLEPK